MPASSVVKDPLYFLEVVKEGEQPSWSLEDPALVSASQPLTDGYVQFWAHPKDSVIQSGSHPPCEQLTKQYKSNQPILLVNQLSNGPVLLELLIIDQGHVWVRSESNLENLEDTVAAVLDYAKKHFGMRVEGFMTSDSVTEEVEKKMDQIEGGEDDLPHEKASMAVSAAAAVAAPAIVSSPEPVEDTLADEPEVNVHTEEEVVADDGPIVESPVAVEPVMPVDHPTPVTHLPVEDEVPPAHTLDSLLSEEEKPSSFNRPAEPSLRAAGGSGYTPPVYGSLERRSGSSSKLWLLLPVVVLLAAVGGAYMYKDQLMTRLSGVGFLASAPSPSPSAIPTPSVEPSPTVAPVPAIDRSKYTLRVLNGTTKSGAAGTLADQLKGKGWQIERTGNATNSATPQTLVRVKPGMEDLLTNLIQDLAPGLKAASSSALKSTDRSDAEVVIGAE